MAKIVKELAVFVIIVTLNQLNLMQGMRMEQISVEFSLDLYQLN